MSGLRDVAATLVVLLCRGVLAVAASLALLAVAPALLGMTSTVVMSDSMSPGIRAGDVVVVRAIPLHDVRVGEVVLADDPSFPGRLRLHRLAEREHGRFLLKGDANAQADPTPVAGAAVHGIGFLRVPWVGLPLLWLRTGEPLLAAAAVGGLAAAALLVAALDDTGGVTALRIGRRIALAVVRNRRGRLARVGLLGLLGLVVAAPTLHAHLALGPSSWARFTSTSTSPGNTLATEADFTSSTCWAMPSPTPDIAYSFSTPPNAASPTAEPNAGGLGSSSNYDAVLSSASLRVAGSCVTGQGPSVRFSGSGGESVVSDSRIFPASNPGTETLWFSPAAATGVLADLGSQNGTDSSLTDRQLYFTSGGKLAFVMRNGGAAPVTCSIPTAVTLNAWHFAAVTYADKAFTLYYDGTSTSCSGTLTTAPSTTSWVRIGGDVQIAPDASSGAYSGSIDEVYEYGAVRSTAEIGAIRANGH